MGYLLSGAKPSEIKVPDLVDCFTCDPVSLGQGVDARAPSVFEDRDDGLVGDAHLRLRLPAGKVLKGDLEMVPWRGFDVADQDVAPATEKAAHATTARLAAAGAAAVVVIDGKLVVGDGARADRALLALCREHAPEASHRQPMPIPERVLRKAPACLVPEWLHRTRPARTAPRIERTGSLRLLTDSADDIHRVPILMAKVEKIDAGQPYGVGFPA